MTNKQNIINELNEAMEFLVLSVGSTVAPERRIELIKETYKVLFDLRNELDGEKK